MGINIICPKKHNVKEQSICSITLLKLHKLTRVAFPDKETSNEDKNCLSRSQRKYYAKKQQRCSFSVGRESDTQRSGNR